MLAITKGIALFDFVTSLATPIAHFTIVLTPGVYGTVANGDLSPSSSLTLEVRSFVHVVIDATANASNGVSGG